MGFSHLPTPSRPLPPRCECVETPFNIFARWRFFSPDPFSPTPQAFFFRPSAARLSSCHDGPRLLSSLPPAEFFSSVSSSLLPGDFPSRAHNRSIPDPDSPPRSHENGVSFFPLSRFFLSLRSSIGKVRKPRAPILSSPSCCFLSTWCPFYFTRR